MNYLKIVIFGCIFVDADYTKMFQSFIETANIQCSTIPKFSDTSIETISRSSSLWAMVTNTNDTVCSNQAQYFDGDVCIVGGNVNCENTVEATCECFEKRGPIVRQKTGGCTWTFSEDQCKFKQLQRTVAASFSGNYSII